MEAGWLLEEKKMHRLDDEDEGGFSPKHLHQTTTGVTIWDYIDKHHRKTPLFYNFLYSQGDQEVVSWFLVAIVSELVFTLTYSKKPFQILL